MSSENTVIRIFYSSMTEPELLVFYADGISYLKDSEVDLEVIDVADDQERASEENIESTPTVIVEKDGEKQKEIGVVSYLGGVLERDEIENMLKEA